MQPVASLRPVSLHMLSRLAGAWQDVIRSRAHARDLNKCTPAAQMVAVIDPLGEPGGAHALLDDGVVERFTEAGLTLGSTRI